MLAVHPGMSALTAEVEEHVSEPRQAKDSVEALVRGDRQALAALYREHHQAVRGLVRRFLADEAAVEDVVHDTFLAAPAAFARFRGDGNERSYLYSMAVHRVQDHVRSTSRRRGWLARFSSDPVTTRAPVATPADETDRARLATRLRQALDTLGFEHRAVVVLCEVEEMTSPEVARILSIPEGTVRTRLHHAKKRLRELLGDVHGE